MTIITLLNTNIHNLATRWLFSTNHKDIGIFYNIFAAISLLAGIALFLSIAVDSSSSDFAALNFNYHLYIVIIAGYAFIGTFSLAMLVLIEGASGCGLIIIFSCKISICFIIKK